MVSPYIAVICVALAPATCGLSLLLLAFLINNSKPSKDWRDYRLPIYHENEL